MSNDRTDVELAETLYTTSVKPSNDKISLNFTHPVQHRITNASNAWSAKRSHWYDNKTTFYGNAFVSLYVY